MARRIKRRGFLSGNMMWYIMYGIAGYFAYNWYMGSQSPMNIQQDTSIPPAALLP